MQVGRPPFQLAFILLPPDPVASCRSFPLQCVETVPQKFRRQMTEQSREPLSPPSSRCLAHTRQPLGHDFLPSLTSALKPPLGGSPLFGRFPGTTAQSDSSVPSTPDVRLSAFSGRSAPLPSADSSEVSWFSRMKFPGVPGVYDYAGSSHTRATACRGVAFPLRKQGRHPE